VISLEVLFLDQGRPLSEDLKALESSAQALVLAYIEDMDKRPSQAE